MRLPTYVIKVIDIIKEKGKEAFLVGGCVRDSLMGYEAADYDLTTSATIHELLSWFEKTVPVGEKHGTIAVIIDGNTVEVSTFRGCLHPSQEGLFALEEDLFLRDFTINAIAADVNGVLYDPFGGYADIRKQLIRSPQNKAEERFREDPLRMMRAVRFSCTLGFNLHASTFNGILKYHTLIRNVSAERIREEFNKIILSKKPSHGIRLLLQTGLLEEILPEAMSMVNFNQHSIRHDKDVFEHTMAVLEGVPARLKVRLAAFFHDIAKPSTFTIDEAGAGHFYDHHIVGRKITEKVLKRMRYDNHTVQDVSVLVAEHMSRFPRVRNSSLKMLFNRLGEHNLIDLFDLQRADIMGAAPPFDFSLLDMMQEEIEQILNENPPIRVKDLAVNGHDLKAIGVEPGPEMGKILNFLLSIVLDDPAKNKRYILLDIARDYL